VLVVISAEPATSQIVVQPGIGIVNEGGAQCTTNWVYDGEGALAGNVFIGTAAHCVESVGEEISELSSGEVIGTVAFVSPDMDYSLIRVADESAVSPAMKGHPEFPSGFSTVDTAGFGDIVQFSGYGLGFSVFGPTQESRVGVLHTFDGEEWSALGPVAPGDSGGPVGDATDGNKALGVVDVLCVGTSCLGAGGVSVAGLLDNAADNGFPITLRTVN
jgi:hypothetical protein